MIASSPTSVVRGLAEGAGVDARRRARRAQFRRRRAAVAGILAGLCVAGYAAFDGGGGQAGRPAALRSELPAPDLRSLVVARQRVPGHRPPLPWASVGQGAVAVLGSGLVARSPHQHAVPIASLTKMMTAFVILRDHPLALGQAGPSIRMTRADVALWQSDSQAGDSTVPVRDGEVLDEYQMLEALLIPSGDNVATMLADWDAGSLSAFVAKMNVTARGLGLDHTRYADASGVDPASRSTAADQATLAAQLMDDPVVRQIVARPRVAFPVAGTIWNYNPGLRTDGIDGVKSGYTSEAQGCLVTSAYREVGGRSVLVVVASTGQPDGLYGAAATDERLLQSAAAGLVRYRILPAQAPVATARFAWSSDTVAVTAPSAPTSIVTWPGTELEERVVPSTARLAVSSARTPVAIGTLAISSSGGLALDEPLDTVRPAPAVPTGWAPAG